MPPRQKMVSKMPMIDVETGEDVNPANAPIVRLESFLKPNAIVNIVFGGRTHQNYEVLGWDGQFVKFRGDVSIAPQTEVVLIPYAKIEAIGLVNER